MRFGDDQYCETCRYDFLNPPTEPEPTVPLAGQAPGQAAPATSNEANPVENQPAVPLAQ